METVDNQIIKNSSYEPHAFEVNTVLKADDMVEMDAQIYNNLSYIKHLTENKQDKLVSGSNIKTINDEDIVGEGDIDLTEFVVDTINKDLDENYGITKDGIDAQHKYFIKIASENDKEYPEFEVDHTKELNKNNLFNDINTTSIFSYPHPYFDEMQQYYESFDKADKFLDRDYYDSNGITNFNISDQNSDNKLLQFEIKNIKLSVGLISCDSYPGDAFASGNIDNVTFSPMLLNINHPTSNTWFFSDQNNIQLNIKRLSQKNGSTIQTDITSDVSNDLDSWDYTYSLGSTNTGNREAMLKPHKTLEFIDINNQNVQGPTSSYVGRYLFTPKNKNASIKINNSTVNTPHGMYILSIILPKINLTTEGFTQLGESGSYLNYVVHLQCDIIEHYENYTHIYKNITTIKRGQSNLMISDEGIEMTTSVGDKNNIYVDKYNDIKSRIYGVKVNSEGIFINNGDSKGNYKKLDEYINDLISKKLDETAST